MLIDAHQHFWKIDRGDYTWFTPAQAAIQRDFLPADLQPILQELNIKGTIVVQAAASAAETQFILNLALQYDFILGVVGWVDMLERSAIANLEQLAGNPYLRGIRLMLHDLEADNWILQPNLTPIFRSLVDLNLTFDALIYPRHLKYILRFANLFPDLKIVIDHAAKPLIAKQQVQPWADDLGELALLPNVYCKLSGLVTEALPNWQWHDLYPYMDQLFVHFGNHRILWGSDWPVLTLATTYQAWFQFCYQYVDQNNLEANSIFGATAIQFYNLLSKL